MNKVHLSAMATLIVVVITAIAVGSLTLNSQSSHAAIEATVLPANPTVLESDSPDTDLEEVAMPAESQHAPGIPAVKAKEGVQATRANAAFDVPAIMQYLRETPPVWWDQSTPLPTIAGVEIMTAGEAAQRFDTQILRPDDELVCVVTLSGSFAATGPHIPDKGPTVVTSDTEILIFGAQNGNLLKVKLGQ